jgi:hypothetical protein
MGVGLPGGAEGSLDVLGNESLDLTNITFFVSFGLDGLF